ncbi:MAG: RNA polymerase sigma factor [Solirubrobacteraceae bacterium]
MSAASGSAGVGEQVRAFGRGDSAAGEWLARRACRLALRTAGAIMRSREQAADVAQDVAVDVLVSLPRLRDPEAFDAWVHRITVRHALRALRSRRGRVEARLEELGEGELLIGEPRDLDLLLSIREALSGGLERLSARQRLALALRYVHDLSDEEIAAALGCRPGSVHALLSRGRAALRADQTLIELAKAISGG